MRQAEEFQRAIEQIRALFDRYLRPGAVVYLFGSSVRDDYTAGSDIDLAVEGAEPESLSIIRTALEESTIPYRVDIVDLSISPEGLRESVRKEGVVIWRG